MKQTWTNSIFLVAFGWMWIALPLSIVDPAYSEKSQCTSLTFISHKKKWMSEALYDPLVLLPVPPDYPYDAPGVFTASNPSYCFYFYSSTEYKNRKGPYSYETLTRSAGYLEAIEKLWSERALDEHPEHWPKGVTVRDRIEELTGIRFDSKDKLRNWFLEHVHYLVWSEQKKALVVDKKAFESKNFIHHFFYGEDLWPEDKRAENFWKLKLDGAFLFGWRVGDYIKGETLGMHAVMADYKFHISALNDLEAKKKAYKGVLESSINSIIHRNNKFSEGVYRKSRSIPFRVLSKMKEITGLNFKTVKEWMDWYEQNKNRLTLSKNGNRLVPNDQ